MFIGIDIGGTSCRIATTLSLENITNFSKKEFKLTHNFKKDFSIIVDTINNLTADKITAIGIGVPGDLNDEKTSFIDPAKNLGWGSQPIKSLFENEFNCPVFLENDAAAAGLGEAIYGNTKNGNFAFVIWGTGIGGTLVTKSNGMYTSNKLDWHGYFKDWESDCGGNHILKRYGKEGSSLSEEEWKEVMSNFRKHIEEFVTKTQINNIVFGGGIAIKQSQRVLKLQEYFPSIQLTISSLGESCGLYGAFALIRNNV